MIDLRQNEREIVLNILRRYLSDAEVFVFGSRATGTASQWSDLDLLIRAQGPVDDSRMNALKEAFSASDLGIRVDLVDWYRASESFQSVISSQLVPLDS